MVADTRPVSVGAPDPSQAKPLASEPVQGQELATQVQEPGQQPQGTEEKGPVDAFWEGLSPEAQVEYAKRLTPEQLRENPVYQETLRRDRQSAEDRAAETRREADRRRAEEETVRRRGTEAERKLKAGIEASDEAAVLAATTELAEVKVLTEYYPSMQADLDRATENAPHFQDFSEEDRREIFRRQREWGQEVEHRMKASMEAAYRLGVEATKKNFEGSIKTREKAAFETGKLEAIREARGEIPPRLGAGSSTPTKAYRDLTDEERAALSSQEIDARTRRFIEESSR